jgi:hypothetical protein
MGHFLVKLAGVLQKIFKTACKAPRVLRAVRTPSMDMDFSVVRAM